MTKPNSFQVPRSTSFEFSQITPDAVSHLKTLEYSHTGTRRLCLHSSNDSHIHMMLIEIQSNTIFERHQHYHSDEAVFLLEGKLEYELDDGTIYILSETSSRSIILPMNSFHTVKSGPNGALYLEVINGPFTKPQS